MPTDLTGLFLSAFIASTLLPGGSELVLVYLYSENPARYLLLLSIASLGNTLGAMSSWGIGRLLAWRFPARCWKDEHVKAIARLQRYGSPVLLLSWLPFIGDPLCVAAGWMRLHWLKVLLFIAIGKLLRYLFVLEVARASL